MPFGIRKGLTSLIAGAVYWPLARAAKLGDRLGWDTDAFPLSAYKDSSFYTMRTDSLGGIGTRLEHRLSRAEIEKMMHKAGLEQVRFLNSCLTGPRSADAVDVTPAWPVDESHRPRAD